MSYVIKEFDVDKTKTFMENIVSCLDKQYIENIHRSTLEETSFSQLKLSIVSTKPNTGNKQSRGNTSIRLISGIDRITDYVDVCYQKLNLFRFGYLVDDETMHIGIIKSGMTHRFDTVISDEIKEQFITNLRTRFDLGTTGKIRFKEDPSDPLDLLVINEMFYEGDTIQITGDILESEFWVADTEYESEVAYNYIKKFKCVIQSLLVGNRLNVLRDTADGFMIGNDLPSNIKDTVDGFIIGGNLTDLHDNAAGFVASDKDLIEMKDPGGWVVGENDLLTKLSDTVHGFKQNTDINKTLNMLEDIGFGWVDKPKGK